MKKTMIFGFALVWVAQMSFANVVTGVAAIPANYYNAVDGKKNADAILNALNGIIGSHTVLNYNALEDYYEQTDFYADTLWDMYSTCYFTMQHANVAQQKVCDGWNKEHLVCQSWFSANGAKSDLFNVYPTDARINNLRSAFPYGVVGTNNGFSKDPDHHGLGKLGTSTTSGVGTCYEPDDAYKGDFARSFFYMVACYRNGSLNAAAGAKMFTAVPTNLTAYSLSFLLDWHRNDPVSQKEIDRNQAVYGIQHNRNPFIDYPELVEYIWGNKAGQTINLASMTPTCEGGGYDPTIVTKYGVTWIANGETLGTDSVVAGRAVTAMPNDPAPCSTESTVFMGWTDEPIDSVTDDRPAVLYKSISDIPVVSADKTYYAVFAKATEGAEVIPATYTFDADHTEGWTNTASVSGSYWLLDQGKVLTSPEVNLAGLASIDVNMRTYGGTQYCNLDIKAGTTQIATIVATAGKVLTDYTWTNSQALTGSSALSFSSNYGSGKGIGIASVTIHATGSGTTYSRFVTTCQNTTALDETITAPCARKVLIDGHLYILVGDKIYTITGYER